MAETVDDPAFIPFEGDLHEALVAVLSSPNVASKRWIFEQYDSFVQGQTVASAGSDAAVDPGPRHAEGARRCRPTARAGSVIWIRTWAPRTPSPRPRATSRPPGAKPLAITNCMNFGNPERPVVMWQFAEAIRGMRDACLAFDTPVTGGNVSFYNESGDSAIWPTPVIGMLGLLEDYRLRVPTGFARAGLSICVLGETFAELGGSEFADVVLGVISGRPPALDLERERALLDLLHEAASDDLLASAHDCGDGGLAVTLAEQAILSGHGFVVTVPGDLPPHVALFSESASRAVVAVAPERVEELADLAAARGVPFATVGETGGPRVVFDGLFETTVARAPRRLRGRDPAAAGRGRVIRAVTFDYWETLVSEGAGIDAEEDGTMRARQLRRWSEILAAAGMPVSDAAIDAAFDRNWEVFHESWRTNVQHGPAEATPLICDLLGVDSVTGRCERSSSRSFAEVGRTAPLRLAPGAEECLRGLKDAGVRIGIVCDVGMTASPTLRERLDMFGVLRYFDHWSFSDEVGCFKPWPAVFEHALAGLGVDDPVERGARRRQPADRRGRRAGDGDDGGALHLLPRRSGRRRARGATTCWTTTRSSRPRSGSPEPSHTAGSLRPLFA